MNEQAIPGWPRCLSRAGAAVYLGVSVDTFDAEVRAGVWPQPERRGMKGGRLTWDRLLLDSYQDRRSRLLVDPSAEADDPDPTGAAAAAWKERIHATSPRVRS